MKAGLEQQILRRIAGDGQFWEGHEVGLGLARFLDPRLDQARVADNIPDGRIDLGHGNSERPHI
jgi:hypothetical protein